MHNKKDKKENKDKVEKVNFEVQAAANLAGWQKALADYQNLQKEMSKRLSDMNDFVAANFLLELLPIFDNYQIAISHVPAKEKKEAWAVGLEHILKLWESFLTDHGLSKIKALGEQFDPNLHEAVGQINDKEKADQIILEEKLAGYTSKDRVIRPAKVIINNN
ncbi:MAG: nucleotide exchange factor GrpE [Patescibacteria group bacterium]|jgi:molecular chaperone GrpE